MKTPKTTEIVILILTVLPFTYLAVIYGSLPQEVPMHYNASGEVDRMGNKAELWILPLLLNGMTYFLFKYLPKLDPKNQIQKMGNNYHNMRLGLTVVMTLLACGIIYMSSNLNATVSVGWVYGLIGIMFILLGNYMPAMKPNYFVGIRTPWTLENETVWRKTHKLGAWLFIASGILVILSAVILSDFISLFVVLGTTIAILLTSFIYSYRTFKNIHHV